jgi:hypothetical protein
MHGYGHRPCGYSYYTAHLCSVLLMKWIWQKQAPNPSIDGTILKQRAENTEQKSDAESYHTMDGQIHLRELLVLFTEQRVGNPAVYLKKQQQQQPGRTQFSCICCPNTRQKTSLMSMSVDYFIIHFLTKTTHSKEKLNKKRITVLVCANTDGSVSFHSLL